MVFYLIVGTLMFWLRELGVTVKRQNKEGLSIKEHHTESAKAWKKEPFNLLKLSYMICVVLQLMIIN